MFKTVEIATELDIKRYHSIDTLEKSPYTDDQVKELKEKFWKEFGGYESIDPFPNSYHRSVLAKYVADSKFSDIPKGSVGFILGNSRIGVKETKAVMNHYGLIWERKDESKADFYIVGDKPSEKRLGRKFPNLDLSRPMIMTEEIRVEYYFNVIKKDSIQDMDIPNLGALLKDYTSVENLYLVSSLIRHASRGSISDKNKFYLTRAFCNTFSHIEFEPKNSKHKEIYDAVYNNSIPHHRYLLGTSLRRIRDEIISEDSFYSPYTEVGDFKSLQTGRRILQFKGSDEVPLEDIENDYAKSIINQDLNRRKGASLITRTLVKADDYVVLEFAITFGYPSYMIFFYVKIDRISRSTELIGVTNSELNSQDYKCSHLCKFAGGSTSIPKKPIVSQERRVEDMKKITSYVTQSVKELGSLINYSVPDLKESAEKFISHSQTILSLTHFCHALRVDYLSYSAKGRAILLKINEKIKSQVRSLNSD